MLQKRNIVLAALILALGSAVYINWRYTAENSPLQAVGGTGSSYAPQLGDVLYVNGEVQSQLTSDSGGISSAQSENKKFSEATLSRQLARDEAVELLKEILASAEHSEAAKKEAVAQAAAIAAAIEREAKIESLLKAKGYENCLAFIDGNKANILVESDGLLPNETITIKDIVYNQSGISFADIVIVEVK